MSNRSGGRSDGKGGSSGNAAPPAPAQSDSNKQTQPVASDGATPASGEQAAPAASTEASSAATGTEPAPETDKAQNDDKSEESGEPAKVERPAAPPSKASNATRAARLKVAGYTRPSVEEFAKAGYDAADYEAYFDKHEARLEAELDERATAAKLVPPQPGWIRCRALKTSLVRGMVKGPGEEFWLSEEEALRAIDKGSAEPL